MEHGPEISLFILKNVLHFNLAEISSLILIQVILIVVGSPIDVRKEI